MSLSRKLLSFWRKALKFCFVECKHLFVDKGSNNAISTKDIYLWMLMGFADGKVSRHDTLPLAILAYS